MKNSLPGLSTLVLLAASAAATAQDAIPASTGPGTGRVPSATATPHGGSAGDRLLVQAINQFERHQSVTAHMRHQASLGGTELFGAGNYWQLGSGENLRVRMELKIGNQEGSSLLHVSNRGILWVDRQLPSGRSVTRFNLRQLRADPVLSAGNFDSIQPGEASWSPMQPELTAHCGGLTSLLSSLGEHFTFMPPQPMRLALAPPLTAQPTTVPVFAMVGHWKPQKLSALTGASQESRVEGQEPESKIPTRLPQEVLLLVGQADLFPYRVEYRRLETRRAANDDGTAIPYQLSAQPLVVLELSDVAFDVPIDGGQFDYNPKDVDWVDQTAKLLERLRKQRQAQVGARSGAGQSR